MTEIQIAPSELGASTAPDEGGRSRQLRDRFDLLSPPDLAALIGVDVRTLTTWRAQKRGPDAVHAGRAVFYRRKDVDAWLAFNVVPMDRSAA
jgi:predicted DNA-binding transcriptional regulator AlpA